MNLYSDGEPVPVSPDKMAAVARLRAGLRRARRCLDEAEERRDAVLLVGAGLSRQLVAECMVLSRRKLAGHLAAWSQLQADSQRGREEKARHAIATAVSFAAFAEAEVDQLVGEMIALYPGGGAVDEQADRE